MVSILAARAAGRGLVSGALASSLSIVALRRWLLGVVNRLLAPVRLQLVSAPEMRALAAATELPDPPPPPRLPDEAVGYLSPGNPRLAELRRRYAEHPACAASRWTDEFVRRQIDLRDFRADGPFVWSSRDAYVSLGARKLRRGTRDVNYVLSAYYARAVDELGVLARCADDGQFGSRRVVVDDALTVTRDLLDSTLELNFLERHLRLSRRPGAAIVDIGGGYGRLAHRAVQALPDARVLCTDGVPESTFIAEYYLRFRGVEDRAVAVPVDELDTLRGAGVELATNVHSWSECPLQAIVWWLDWIVSMDIPHLLIVPNDGEALLSLERDGRRLDFAPELGRRGFSPAAREPKYGHTSVQQLGVYPTHYQLFSRS
jgi:hypothetical protein